MADELDDGLALDDQLVAGGSGDEGQEAQPTHDAQSEAKERRRAKQKAARRKVRGCSQRAEKQHERTSAERALATQPAALQADYICAQQRRVYPSLSALELDEVRVSEHMLTETVSWDRERTLDTLAPFVTQCALVLTDVKKPLADSAPGAPRIVVVSGNAQRAADLVRPLRTLLPKEDEPPRKKRAGASADEPTDPSQPTVAKLFARHFKADAQASWLKTQVAPIVVGTPHRLRQLIDMDALRLDDAAAIVIDHSWVDQKQRTIFDGPETRVAIIDLIGQQRVREALRRAEKPCRLLLF